MRKYIILALVWLIAPMAIAQNLKLEGRFISKQKEFLFEDISAFQYLQPQNPARQVKTDSVGNFKFSTNLTAPGYYRIGRNILYLMPGDNLKMVIDHQNPVNSTFSGKGETVNNYLRVTPFPKGGSFLEAGKIIAAQPEATLMAIQHKADERLALLEKLQANDLFKYLERSRVKADLVNSVVSVRNYAGRKLKLSPDSLKSYLGELDQLSATLIKSAVETLKDPSLLQLVVYRDIVPQLISRSKDKKAFSKASDWLRADSLVKVMTSLDSKQKIAAFTPELEKIASADFKKAALLMKDDLLKYGKGDVAIDFVAKDPAGKTVRLSDLKGKVIYIDLWATWCGPCLAEMPAFEQLRKKFADQKNVAFVSLSIDDDTEKWKRNMLARKADGLQWHISKSALKDYQVVNIPRSIVIDADFKIADFQALLPSDPATSILIDKLLKKDVKSNTVSGKFTKIPSSAVLYLSYVGDNGKSLRDSVKLVNGTFELNVKASSARQAKVLLSNSGEYAVKKNSDVTIIYIGEEPVAINGVDSIATAKVEGGLNNRANQIFKEKMVVLEKGRTAILYALTPEKRKDKAFVDSMKMLNQQLIEKQRSLQREFVRQYPDLIASLDVLKAYAGPIIELQDVEPLYNSLSSNVKSSADGLQFGQTLTGLKGTAIGQLAPSFSLPDVKGNIIKLSDFKGKYVLLDFWASWCVPCRSENPNLVKNFLAFKEKNFTILGVSMDNQKAKGAWLDAIKADGLLWTNLSDLKAFDSEVAKMYQINAIPQNFLIDPAGKIIGKNLKGEELSRVLSTLLK